MSPPRDINLWGSLCPGLSLSGHSRRHGHRAEPRVAWQAFTGERAELGQAFAGQEVINLARGNLTPEAKRAHIQQSVWLERAHTIGAAFDFEAHESVQPVGVGLPGNFSVHGDDLMLQCAWTPLTVVAKALARISTDMATTSHTRSKVTHIVT